MEQPAGGKAIVDGLQLQWGILKRCCSYFKLTVQPNDG
jgi:hypothetical protein